MHLTKKCILQYSMHGLVHIFLQQWLPKVNNRNLSRNCLVIAIPFFLLMHSTIQTKDLLSKIH